MDRNKQPENPKPSHRQSGEPVRRQHYSQPAVARRPLKESTARQNVISPKPSSQSKANSQQITSLPLKTPRPFPIQHHESMQSGGQLQNLENAHRPDSISSAPTTTVVNPRLSAVISEDQNTKSNRSSQISTTSTNASTKSKQKTHIGPWRLGRTLGKGSTARVRLAKHELTGQLAAIKIVSKKMGQPTRSHSLANDKMKALMMEGGSTETSRRLPFGIEREVVIMKLIEHPNVIQLLDVWENRNELYLVLEYVDGGELWQHLYDHGRFEERQAVSLFRQILSAISHCHQFNICHRDMKPENILLDKNGNIKLADFGMAALQPRGVMLLTSCGSPHYAAPELLQGKEYDGSKVDIWAIGIILYSLLAGTLPFDGSSIPRLLAKILKGKYYMPPEFSKEARNLITCLLQTNPEKRLGVAEIWHHPLLVKYNQDSLIKIDGYGERWIGPPPPISSEDIGRPVGRASDIDREILRNLQTLWHGEDADILIKRILSRELNQEKIFYNLLMKYRERSLEDYQGPSTMNYSASDYHHIPSSAGRRSSQYTRSYTRIDSRQGSRYSVVSRDYDGMDLDEQDESRTEKSYDPFRASRAPVVNENGDYNVTILRNRSNTKRSRASSMAKHSTMARLQDSPLANRTNSRSSVRGSARDRPSQPTNPIQRTGSRGSLGSSKTGFKQGVIRPRQTGKRDVAFNHGRRKSTIEGTATLTPEPKRRTAAVIPSTPTTAPPSSPPVPRSLQIFSLKTPSAEASPSTRRPRADSTVWKDASRKASIELSALLDEAFKPRSSIGSSILTKESDAFQYDYKTPISSYTGQDAYDSPNTVTADNIRARYDDRPLPPPPSAPAPDPVGISELQKTKARLMERAAVQGDGPSRAYLDDMIERLDRMMLATQPPPEVYPDGRRVVSDATSYGAQRHVDKGSALNSHKPSEGYRNVSEPMPASRPANRARPNYDRTIRVVDHQSSPIQPLSFDKKSPRSWDDEPTMRGALASPTGSYDGHDESIRGRGYSLAGPLELETIHEVAEKNENRTSKQESIDNKKRSWWKRRSSGGHSDVSKSTGSSREEWPLSSNASNGRVNRTGHYPTNGPPLPAHKETGGRKTLFSGVFGKRRPESKSSYNRVLTARQPNDIDFDTASIESSATDYRCSSIAPSELFVTDKTNSNEYPRQIVHVQQNWLARIFHIRPRTKVLCFSVGRRRARREIVAVLREWRKYGMKDIAQDRERNVVFARVDVKNFLKIKPVSLAAEVLTILEDGRRAGLSTARFTQEKGAASSFAKVMDTLEKVLRARGLLVEDGPKAREMADLTKEVLSRKEIMRAKI